MNLNGVEYYYIRNTQGDIIGLFDKTGVQVVSYTYDTWGKLISTTGTLASTVGAKNPYRYRGYRYDAETGLYYLQSRYYNADWGRFINANGVIGQTGEILGHNLFSYCKNNPVNMHDDAGFKPAFDSVEDQTDYYDYLYSIKAGAAAKPKLKGSSGVSYDYRGTAVATVATIAQNVPLKVTINYLKSATKASMAELGVCSNVFAGISIVGLGYSIHSNHLEYQSSEAAAMDAVDKLTFALGMFAGAALLSVSAPAVFIVLGGLAIGYGGYYAKKQIDRKYYN